MNKQSFLLPNQGSTIAQDVDTLFYFILIASIVIFAIVVAGLIFFTIRYRRQSAQPEKTYGKDHNLKLELIWSIIPTILVIIVFAWGFKVFLDMNVVPRDAMEIKVTGKKWLWTFDYPNGANSINNLVVPVDQPVKLVLSSEDVIHSFFVPGFRIKMDVLPNRYNVTWFEAVEEGEYQLFCAEYCGTGHSDMLGKVNVVSQEEYDQWLAKGLINMDADMPLEDLGAKLYTGKACNTCHTIDGTPLVGPSFKDVFGEPVTFTDGSATTIDENYIRQSILEPRSKIVAGYQPVMPTYQNLLKDRDVDALIAYIKSLKD